MLPIMSIPQVLDVWTQLEEAREGKANYGGDVAEIYINRLMPSGLLSEVRMLSSDMFGKDVRRNFQAANQGFHDLFLEFEERRSCEVYVEDRRVGPWMLSEEPFVHRIHVKVVRKSLDS